MTDELGAEGTENLRYNSKGYLIGPQTDGVWAVITGLYAMAIPLLVTKTTIQSPFPPIFLQKTALFQISVAHNLLTIDQIAKIEFLFVILIFVRLCGFPAFFRKHGAKYSAQHPPPTRLRTLWPPQIRGRLYIAICTLSVPLLSGVIMQHGIYPSYMKQGEVLLAILILSLGIWFLMESIFCAALFSFFYFRFWKPLSKAPL